MNNSCYNKPLLALARNPTYEELRKEGVFLAARDNGLLLRLFQNFRILPDSVLVQQIKREYSEWKTRSSLQMGAIFRFVQEADEQSLRFAIIKGIPLSRKLYGDGCARCSSDVDIIISPDDVPKAHYVATQAGFCQPVESFRARQMAAIGALDSRVLEGIASRYPIRNSSKAPHLAPYLYIDSASSYPIVLDVHDKFYGMGHDLCQSLLWDTECIDRGERFGYRIPAPALSFVTLAMAAHNECEGIRSNLGDGALGLKLLVDMKQFIHRGAPLSTIAQLAEAHKIQRVLGEVFYDLVQVFPELYEVLEPYTPFYKSCWGCSYIRRLVDVSERRASATQRLEDALENVIAGGHDGSIPTVLLKGARASAPPLSGKIEYRDGKRYIVWTLAEGVLADIDNLILEAFLIWNDDAPSQSAGLVFSVYGFNGTVVVRFRELALVAVDYHVSQNFGEDCANLLSIRQAGALIKLVISADDLGLAIPKRYVSCFALHKRDVAGVYQLVAGQTYADCISNALGRN